MLFGSAIVPSHFKDIKKRDFYKLATESGFTWKYYKFKTQLHLRFTMWNR
ncbi:unnamed protein product, partial [Larinioides sclopetarius]